MARFSVGQSVWISPGLSGEWVIEDEAIVLDDLEDGYIVLQGAERLPSHGSGHFVQDTEVLAMMN
jgi:hypothetical protein